MKPLIALMSCEANRETRLKACLETWVPRAIRFGWDVQVFTGSRLRVPDDYASLILKTKAMFTWSFVHNYTHTLKIDDDSFIYPERLRVPKTVYAGVRVQANDGGDRRIGRPDEPAGTYPFTYASGGAYWLDRVGAHIIAGMPLNGDWAEDRYVGNTLGKLGFSLYDLPKFGITDRPPIPEDAETVAQLTIPQIYELNERIKRL